MYEGYLFSSAFTCEIYAEALKKYIMIQHAGKASVVLFPHSYLFVSCTFFFFFLGVCKIISEATSLTPWKVLNNLA